MPSSFSLIIPIYNEEPTLRLILDKVKGISRISQIIFVNDGSHDRSAEILKEELEKFGPRGVLVNHEVNQGKGAAIRSAFKVATSEYGLIQDADLEYDPVDLDKMMDLLEKKEAEVVYGSRFLVSNPGLYWTYLLGNKFLTFVANVFGGGHLTDSYTCYKGMSLRAWRALDLNSSGFEIEAEITIKCLMAKWKIKEVPIGYNPRAFESGKKIRSTDALKGILKILWCWISRAKPKK